MDFLFVLYCKDDQCDNVVISLSPRVEQTLGKYHILGHHHHWASCLWLLQNTNVTFGTEKQRPSWDTHYFTFQGSCVKLKADEPVSWFSSPCHSLSPTGPSVPLYSEKIYSNRNTMGEPRRHAPGLICSHPQHQHQCQRCSCKPWSSSQYWWLLNQKSLPWDLQGLQHKTFQMYLVKTVGNKWFNSPVLGRVVIF